MLPVLGFIMAQTWLKLSLEMGFWFLNSFKKCYILDCVQYICCRAGDSGHGWGWRELFGTWGSAEEEEAGSCVLGASQKLSPKNILHLQMRCLQTIMKICGVYLSPFEDEEAEAQEAVIADYPGRGCQKSEWMQDLWLLCTSCKFLDQAADSPAQTNKDIPACFVPCTVLKQQYWFSILFWLHR